VHPSPGLCHTSRCEDEYPHDRQRQKLFPFHNLSPPAPV
jgi:hypothetical protein